LAIDMRQSNYEGELVTWIQEARTTCAGIIINPAAYTHTSVAILDALLACELPVIELHLSNPHKREEFRHRSFITLAAKGVIAGFGAHGYELALDAMAQLIGDWQAPVKPAKRAKTKRAAK
jgi:3-dehydroquinate dehydratase-2